MWEQVILRQEKQASDVFEIQAAEWLCGLLDSSILADDRAVYRLIARCNRAKPSLLPADGRFLLALHAPDQFVDFEFGQTALQEKFFSG